MKNAKRLVVALAGMATLALAGCMFIPAAPTGVIEGFVVDHGAGEPVVGAVVMAYPEGGDVPLYTVGSAYYGPVAVTDADGHYRLTVPEGVYTVRAEKDGHAVSVVHGVVVGSTALLDIILKPVFNPDWSLEPPEVTLTGVEEGGSYSGPINFRVDAQGPNDIAYIYVALGKTPGSSYLTTPRQIYISTYTTGDQTIDPADYGVEGDTTFEVVVYDVNENRTHLIRHIYIGSPRDVGGLQPGNLVVNGDFEDGFNGWSDTNDAATWTLDTGGIVGDTCVKGVETQAGNLGRLYQDVTDIAIPGRFYKLSGWIKREGTTGPTVIGLDYVGANGWTPADGYVHEIGFFDGGGTDGWTYFESKPFQLPPMPADCTNLWVLFDFNASTGTAWWDGIELVEVPAPVPAAPVNLSALAVTLSKKLAFYNGTMLVPSGRGKIEIQAAPEGGNLYVELTWDASPDDASITGYRIYRKLEGEPDYMLVGTIAPEGYPTASYTFRDSSPELQVGLEVTYQVRAYIGNTESEAVEASTTPLDIWDVRLVEPGDGATDVSLTPTFRWQPTKLVGNDQYYLWVLWDLALGAGYLLIAEYLNETEAPWSDVGIPDSSYERLQPHRVYQWYIGEAVAYDDFNDPTAISIAVNDVSWLTGNPHINVPATDLFTFTTGDW